MRWTVTIGGLAVLAGGLPACADEEPLDTTETDVDTDVDTDADTDGVEIAYDDGVAEELFAPETGTAGAQIAVRFTAEAYPVEVIGAKFWIGNDGEPNTEFGVRIYASDGNGGKPGTALRPEPFTTVCVFPGGNHWAEADLSAEGLEASADFYVAMDWTTAAGFEGEDAQLLGADYTTPDARTWWKLNEASKWVPIDSIYPAVDRDAMIRAIVRY